jgi:hypothetical protein
VRTMCGGGCGKWRNPAGRGGGLESYSRFACIGAPGGAGGMCALLPLLADSAVAWPGHPTVSFFESTSLGMIIPGLHSGLHS